MKLNFFLFFLIGACSCSFTQGFLWSDDMDKKIESSFNKVELTRSFTPSRTSLEKYLPSYIADQGETSMCVAYALATCRTIIYSRNKNMTNRDDIFRNSFSPFFVYYNVKSPSDKQCTFGLNVLDAVNTLEDKGIAKLSDVEYPNYWPFTTKQLCVHYPPSYNHDVNDAIKYTIDKPKSLSSNLSSNDKVIALKGELAAGNPIFFGMDPFPNSLWGSYGYDSWGPFQSIQCLGWTKDDRQCRRQVKSDAFCFQHKDQEPGAGIGHTMVIIGYDDNKYGGAFQILNSYGKTWGNNGKIWVRYNDLINYSVVFISLNKRFEAFGARYVSDNKLELINDSLSFSAPSYININKKPPYSGYLNKK